MGFTNFIATIWASKIEMALKNVLVFQSIANTNYEGELKNFKDKVRIIQIGEPTVKPYAKDVDLAAPEKINDAASELIADQAYYFNFAVDDVDANQAKQDLLQKSTQNAAFAFAENIDKYIAGLYPEAGLTHGSNNAPIDITSLNVDDVFLEVSEKMSENKIPRANRFAIIPEWLHTKLILAGLATKTQNDQLYENSVVAKVHGYDIILSNNVSKNSAAWDKTRCLFGVRGESFTFAGIISSVEAYRPEKRFEDAVKGLYIYGGKIARPDKTLALYCDKTAEA
ncbi:MAG: hypothetical protein HYS25_13765 [Ignavibacteriales bacterium]|nr:hypothetical protein [Ignavibacteriales bacterium]